MDILPNSNHCVVTVPKLEDLSSFGALAMISPAAVLKLAHLFHSSSLSRVWQAELASSRLCEQISSWWMLCENCKCDVCAGFGAYL